MKLNNPYASFKNLHYLLFFVWLLHSLLYVFAGKIHVDEGMYLTAAALIGDGFQPYRDFFFLQGPCYPYIYGVFQSILGDRLLVARLISLLFGIATFWLLITVARRLGGCLAAVISAAFFAFTSFQVYFSIIARIFSLGNFFIALSWFFISLELTNKSENKNWHLHSAIIAAVFATMTRLTIAPHLVVVLTAACYFRKGHKKHWILFGLTASLSLTIIILPLLISAYSGVIFGFIGFHLMLRPGILGNVWLRKVEILSQLISIYYPWTVLAVITIIFGWRKLKNYREVDTRKLVLCGAMAGSFLLITMGHFSAILVQKAYQVVAYPTAVLLVSWLFATLVSRFEPEKQHRIAFAVILCLALSTFANGREKLPYTPGGTDLQRLAKQAALLREMTQPGDVVLSSNTALLPVEAGRRIHLSFASNEYFPDHSVEFCQKCHVVNNEILTDLFRAKTARVVILSSMSYTLAFPTFRKIDVIERQRIIKVLEENYEIVHTLPNLFHPREKTFFYLVKQS